MRTLRKLFAGAAVVATATALAVGPALADPINGSGKAVTPKETDVVGTGSDTIEFLLDQFSVDYNRTHKTGPRLYSWDALNPKTGAMGDSIKLKSGCTAIPRPDGSGAGITNLDFNTKTGDHKHFCQDFARSSRGRSGSDPTKSKGGIVFVALGKDAVTYATNKTTNAPANLTTAQLAAIYSCTATTWGDVGVTGPAASQTIDAQLPQTSSGTRAFFIKAIGNIPVGSCVNSTAEENEGIDAALQGPNVIFPYSIGKYIAEVDHSAKCTKSDCTGSPACKPSKTQNKFGCDTHGTMVLRKINGTAPTTGTGTKTVINSHFSANFVRTVYVVVRWASTKDNIPAYLEPFFSSSKKGGWACANSTAKADLVSYGFLPTPFCGTGS